MNNPDPQNGFKYNPGPKFEEDNIDIKRYFSLFLSNWYWFAVSLFIVFTIAYGINRYSERIYTVSSTILINDDQNGGGSGYADNFMPGSGLFNNRQNLNNEIGILRSYSLNKRVIDSLPEFGVVYYGVGRRNLVESRLYTRCPFRVVTSKGDYNNLGTKIAIVILSNEEYKIEIPDFNITDTIIFGQNFNYRGFNFALEMRDTVNFVYDPKLSNKYYFYFASGMSLANSYRGKLGVAPINKDATFLSLTCSGPIPEQEAEYLNKLMEIYLQQGLEEKNEIADQTIKFIDGQIKIVSDSLKVAEDSLQKFRQSKKFSDLSKEATVIQGKLDQFESEKSRFILNRQYYEYLKNYLAAKELKGDIISPSIMGISDVTLAKLVSELALLVNKKTSLSMNLSEDLPSVKLIDDNIANLVKQLNENIESNLATVDNSVNFYNGKIEEVNYEIQKLPANERKLLTIQRKFDINNTVYTYLLEKKAETGIARASNVADNRVIDRADPYNAILIKPQKRKNNIKAMFIGMFIPGLIIIILYLLNDKVIDNSDISRKTSVHVIGYVNHNELRKEMPVVETPGSVISESFRSIRTSLKYLIKDNQNPVISITSTISSEGKTFVSVNLAAITASLGKKVLLIGLDLRKPRIDRLFGLEGSEAGMSTYLSCNCEYEDVIQETSVKNLFYASSGPIPPNPAELIDDERLHIFIEKARQQYDFIIIDTPPVAVVSDSLLIAKYVDINLFVVRQRYSSRETLGLIQELYESGRLKNMSIVINDISLTGYYGYGLRYGYYRAYGYSYGSNYYNRGYYNKYIDKSDSGDYFTQRT